MIKNNQQYKSIAMLVHNLYPEDVRVSREAESLSAEGFDVHVICINSTDSAGNVIGKSYEKLNGVYIHRLPIKRKRGGLLRYVFEYLSLTFLGGLKFLRLHIKRRLHVVHVHNMPDILLLSGLIPKFLGARLVLDVHDPMSELFQANYHVDAENLIIKMIKVQERLFYRLADSLITVSRTMAENVAEKSGRQVKDIHVVHNFPNLKIFDVESDLNNWPRKKDSFDLLYAGTITEHYSLNTAVKAIAIAAKDIPNIHLKIIGDGNRIKQILDLAEDLGVSDKVEYIKQVSQKMLKRIMFESDIGISTHSDGVFGKLYFSNKIIEYMTQCLAVLASQTYTFEMYLPESSIFYFEAGNETNLASQMIFMYNNPDLVLHKIKKAKSLIGQYNWDKEKENLLGFYKQWFE